MDKPIVNLAELQPKPRPAEHQPGGEAAGRFEIRQAPIGGRLGARKLGYNLTVVAPGMAAYPLHNHRVNEEMFLVLEGEGELRVGERRHAIRQGDVIACPAGGPETAHQIRNTGTGDLRYLAVSTRLSPEVCEYPDSGKVGVYADFGAGADGRPELFYHMARRQQCLDYWDGE